MKGGPHGRGEKKDCVAESSMSQGLKRAVRSDVFARALRFLGVGGFCFIVTLAVNYGLKFTVMSSHPTWAFLIANTVATVVSFVLSRQFTFQGRNDQHRKRVQMVLFVIVSAIAIGINTAPLYISRWVLGFHTPKVSLLVQEAADFISGPLIGTILAMVFRWWALHRFVFPDGHDDAQADGADGARGESEEPARGAGKVRHEPLDLSDIDASDGVPRTGTVPPGEHAPQAQAMGGPRPVVSQDRSLE